MGTPKRERQKANRQQRQIEQAQAERASAIKRNVIRWSLAAVLAVGAVVLIAWIGGAFSGGDDDEVAVTLPPIDDVEADAEPASDAATDEAAATPPGGTTPADEATGKPSVMVPDELPTELVITDIEEGDGAAAADGDVVEVHYVGVRSADGQEFDNSYDRGAPLTVTLGAGQVIQGWEQGLVGVKVGGVRQIDIPADLAYGDQDRGVIRPGDALSFVVEIIAINPESAE